MFTECFISRFADDERWTSLSVPFILVPGAEALACWSAASPLMRNICAGAGG